MKIIPRDLEIKAFGASVVFKGMLYTWGWLLLFLFCAQSRYSSSCL